VKRFWIPMTLVPRTFGRSILHKSLRRAYVRPNGGVPGKLGRARRRRSESGWASSCRTMRRQSIGRSISPWISTRVVPRSTRQLSGHVISARAGSELHPIRNGHDRGRNLRRSGGWSEAIVAQGTPVHAPGRLPTQSKSQREFGCLGRRSASLFE